uniref:Uncharacterized protein n=1 Tax=Tetranychus urticae TaxID=32264 RepID=T1KEH7_TETUR
MEKGYMTERLNDNILRLFKV